eukprot:gb/GFBE01002164.1/.p1 GENE.gb/GFBE01002164.1/~~gb/GFBE01002164.1/.p1  ORF type:complete len:427 (+),score=93.89 gb/GFBE01002164.1/:1-1281(+)
MAKGCAGFAAAGLACWLIGVHVWSSHIRHEELSNPPMNFLQTRAAVQRQAGETASLIESRGQCPAKLLEMYKDCRVVQARNKIKVGGDGVRPDGGHTVIMVGALDPALLPAGSSSVVGWNPVMQQTKTTCHGEDKAVSLVHHVNVYGYMGDLPFEVGKVYDSTATDDLREENNRMVASHDKDAGEYVLPLGYGISADDPMYVETHLLFPKCWSFEDSVVENSGMELYVTAQALKPAGLVGALNFNMDVQPGQGQVDYVTQVAANKLKNIFPTRHTGPGSALVQDEEMRPEILAIHLHTHDTATSKYFEILDPDGSVHFRSNEEKAGYGLTEQSFISPQEKGWGRVQLQPGQQLRQHCLFDSNTLQGPVHYGLDWGDEMCAPLMVVGGSALAHTGTLLSGEDSWVELLGRSLQAAVQDVFREIRRLV